MIQDILNKVDKNVALTKEDAIMLLQIDVTSPEFYLLLSKANQKSRTEYQNKGYIFAQIGLNAQPCSGNCKFCSLAKDSYSINTIFEKSMDEIIEQVKSIDYSKINSLFLMTTADYPFERFLEIGSTVKKQIPPNINLVANIGDFNDAMANQLVLAGFQGAYHIVRLREGIDTDIPKAKRIETLEAIQKSGLKLYYCVEPIGPEHTPEEIADEMIRARNYHVDVMAIMGRINVSGTFFETLEELSELELTKIAAVARLVTDPKVSMNIHEPKVMPLLAGVNQLYAEIGVNPRDTDSNTENNRGKSIHEIELLLKSVGYSI